MNGQYRFSSELPEEDQVFNLFLTTGWNEAYQITSAEFMVALRNSWYCCSAYKEGYLAGFGRIVCDGVLHALILDLIVDPGCQGMGLGGRYLTNWLMNAGSTASAIYSCSV